MATVRRISSTPARGRADFSEGEQPRRAWPVETAALAVPIDLDRAESDEFALDHHDPRERQRAALRIVGAPQIGGWL